MTGGRGCPHANLNLFDIAPGINFTSWPYRTRRAEDVRLCRPFWRDISSGTAIRMGVSVRHHKVTPPYGSCCYHTARMFQQQLLPYSAGRKNSSYHTGRHMVTAPYGNSCYHTAPAAKTPATIRGAVW